MSRERKIDFFSIQIETCMTYPRRCDIAFHRFLVLLKNKTKKKTTLFITRTSGEKKHICAIWFTVKAQMNRLTFGQIPQFFYLLFFTLAFLGVKLGIMIF